MSRAKTHNNNKKGKPPPPPKTSVFSFRTQNPLQSKSINIQAVCATTYITYLGNVHSARGFKPIITNRIHLLLQKVPELFLLNAFLSNAQHQLILLIQTHSAEITTIKPDQS
jgi:hypothetical protein